MKKVLSLIGVLAASAFAYGQSPPVMAPSQAPGMRAPAQAPQVRTAAQVNVREHPASASDPWFACKVDADLGDGTKAQGSGTPVWIEDGKTLVLTNHHVVADARGDIWVGNSGWSYRATVLDSLHLSDGTDLALLVFPYELRGYVPIAADAPAVGETVWYYGFSGGKLAYHTGTVQKHDGANTYFTGAAIGGDSGSGVFNLAGELVAVEHGNMVDATTYQPTATVAVTTTKVRHFFLRERLRGLFPRLAAKLDAKRAAAAAGAAKGDGGVSKPPAAPAPTAPAPKPTPPTAPPVKKVEAAAPAAQWVQVSDRRGRTTWMLAPVGYSSCPNGQCPIR